MLCFIVRLHYIFNSLYYTFPLNCFETPSKSGKTSKSNILTTSPTIPIVYKILFNVVSSIIKYKGIRDWFAVELSKEVVSYFILIVSSICQHAINQQSMYLYNIL